MTPEEARDKLAGLVNDVGDTWIGEYIVDAVLGDVPLLMQAIGAVRENQVEGRLENQVEGRLVNQVEGRLVPLTRKHLQRWVTPWREVHRG